MTTCAVDSGVMCQRTRKRQRSCIIVAAAADVAAVIASAAIASVRQPIACLRRRQVGWHVCVAGAADGGHAEPLLHLHTLRHLLVKSGQEGELLDCILHSIWYFTCILRTSLCTSAHLCLSARHT
jgi:hypothetical protein